ncbi:SUMF1/EgtB/PvdO family nonheme iron enzyme [Thioflavicoccus mobilis]|uniref:SUMF1/EgtB/PvdO family nonheme iron enzyme n=1 Tax=Thioflavicoccus mobilis TaxID=80679 RepID=UPI00247FC5ED|nr:SUMF1/EgtB/PvdO family nonheme iron enzyme [Thioflavicoccus mobilis]
MATLHSSWGQLPEDRADLYEESVKLLLARWQTARELSGPDGRPVRDPGVARALALGEDGLRAALERLAFEAHRAQGAARPAEDAPDWPAADIGQAQLLDTFAGHCPEDLNPRVLLGYLEERAGLLIARREGVYAFPHRSFQEYLAACHLARTAPDFGLALRDRVRAAPAWWREVFLLGVGKKRQGGLGGAVNLVNCLVPLEPDDPATPAPADLDWRLAALGAAALVELRLGPADPAEPHFATVVRRLRRWLVALLVAGALPPKPRAEAGDLLARLGDPRRGVGVRRNAGHALPDIDWVEIPAGPFVMGSAADDQDAHEDEHGNPAVLDMPERYWIARYPVTVAQYRPFVESGDHADPKWWTADGRAWLRGDYDTEAEGWLKGFLARRPPELRRAPFGWSGQVALANRPVTGVSWFEAMAYARWLDHHLRDGGVDRLAGCCVRLPSEAEWECAARGAEGRRYAWGDDWGRERANVERGIGRPCSVGIFPAGTTPEGLHDLTGNVWEWCRTRSAPYPYVEGDGRNDPDTAGRRVVRGGSWYDGGRIARAASRFWDLPDVFDVDLGFRLVLSLADPGS